MSRGQTVRRRSGFTMIELLTVLGIMVILFTLIVLGVGHVIGNQKEKQTRVMLENCRNLIAEMETSAGLGRQPAHMYVNNAEVKPVATPYDIWRLYDPATKTTTTPKPILGALTW